MTYKKSLSIITIIICILSSTSIVKADNKNKTLIVYENEKVFSYNENVVNHLDELLHKYTNDITNIYINDYKDKMIDEYDYVFVINLQQNIENKSFLTDISKSNKKIYWIGDRIQDLLNYNNYNLEYKNQNKSIHKLNYNKQTILIDNYDNFNIVLPTDKSKVQIMATMSDSYNEYPLVLRSDNLYYISQWKINQSYIFEDTLNDFYNVSNFKKGEIFVRIEDVHLFRDKDKLKEIADYLYSEDVPFMIALIPAYLDSNTGKLNTLGSDIEFVDTIKYMQDKGGTVVLHGYSHTIDNREISGEGYEFWDMEKDIPIQEDIATYVKNRVLSGLRLCVENDIYPLAFEAPHYAMNIDGYKEIKKYFSTYVGQYQNNNDNFTTSTFPYIIKNTKSFNILIPENLGFIESNNEFSIDIIKENFKKLSMVRGYTGGFFYNPYMDINYLKEIISYMKSKDVEFLDLKQMNNSVEVDDISIRSTDGEVDVSYDINKSHKKDEDYINFENRMSSINKIIVIFISVILIIFTIIFIVFRYLNRRKFRK